MKITLDLNLYLSKFASIALRYKAYLHALPGRIFRFIRHPFVLPERIHDVPFYLAEWLFLFFDVIALPEHLENIFDLLNPRNRTINHFERSKIQEIFGNTIDLNRIRLNPDSRIAHKLNIAYVSFYTIHYHKEISLPTLIHEVVHIWQFEKFGSPYIIRSLRAQRSAEGYNYGGVRMLYSNYKKGGNLLDFNYEQMAEIIKDASVFINAEKYPNLKRLYTYFIDSLKR